MLFPTYQAWIEGVRGWIVAYDFTDEQIEQFLALAQIRLNRELKSYRMEKHVDIPISVDLDDAVPDFNKVRNVGWPGVGSLRVLAVNEYYDRLQENPDPGTPTHYCIDAGRLLFYPVPTAEVDVSFDYYQMVEPIGPDRDSNIFTQYHSDALLYAACLEAASYMAEDERIPTWQASYVGAVKGANIESDVIKKGSTPLVREFKSY